MKAAFKLVLASCALAVLTGCGSPGAPQPPSLELARPSVDLTATRKGDHVTLSWTPPTQTTDGQNIRAKFAGVSFVCRAIGNGPMAKCTEAVGQLPPSSPPHNGRGTPAPPKVEFKDTLAVSLQQQNPTGFATYAVEVTNVYGRSAGLSNQVRVPVAPTLAPPAKVVPQVTADGIRVAFPCPVPAVTFPGVSYAAHLYRRNSTGSVASVGFQGIGQQHMPAQCSITDTNFEWEKNYSYWVAVVTTVASNGKATVRVEGDDSPQVSVFVHDVFPPDVPAGLEAVASGVGQKPFVDLTWAPGSDADLDGYNVYRQEQGMLTWTRLTAALAKTPAFRDETAVPGKTYVYSVTAVDIRGNESARSETASETVPLP